MVRVEIGVVNQEEGLVQEVLLQEGMMQEGLVLLQWTLLEVEDRWGAWVLMMPKDGFLLVTKVLD